LTDFAPPNRTTLSRPCIDGNFHQKKDFLLVGKCFYYADFYSIGEEKKCLCSTKISTFQLCSTEPFIKDTAELINTLMDA
jgi:hypothetical protein